MKIYKYAFVLLLSTLIFSSCSSDDENPAPVNEEEVITTVRLTLTDATGTSVVMESQDLDGDGPDDPIITIDGSILASTEYSGAIQFLNELESPADNITLEILEEDEEHQVFYEITGNSGSTITYNDADANGNPIGVSFIFNSGSVGSNNTLVVTLKHEPIKDAAGVSDGLIANAGGETDAETSFNFSVNNL